MVGRNDPCPCDSGRKYKRCCLGNNEKFTEQQVEAELRQTLVNAYEQSARQEDLTEFNEEMKVWKYKLEQFWDKDSIEEAISAYFLFVKRSDLWKRHLLTRLEDTMRTAVRAVLETWEKPIVLLGTVSKVQDGYIEVKQLLSQETYYLKQDEKMKAENDTIAYGVVLPDNRMRENGLYIISSLMFMKGKEGLLKEQVVSLAKSKVFGASTDSFKGSMLDIYEILLDDSVKSLVELSEEAAGAEELQEASVQLIEEKLTPIQEETLELLASTLIERGTAQDKCNLLENICATYLLKEQPNFRKANVVAAGVFRAAVDLGLLNEEPMTNNAVASLFDVSPSSMARHAEAVRGLIPEMDVKPA